jgi:putative spermidine/putrescine transport system substrate-binding protein
MTAKRIDRRAVLALSAALGAAVALGGPALGQDKGHVVVTSYGGTYQDAAREAFFKPFEKATGIKVVEATGPALARMRAMVQSGSPEWDVIDMLPGDFLALARLNMLEKLDYDSFDKSVLAGFDPALRHSHGIGILYYSKVIAFNTKQYSRANGPKSWADVWNVAKFPGPRILDAGNTSVPPIEYALLADGVPPDKLYPLDFARAYRVLARIKPSVVKWTTTAAMQTEALTTGEAVIGPATLGRLQALKEGGAPVDFVWEQALIQYNYWAILKGSKNYKNAIKFIEFASRADSQAELAKRQVLGPMNRDAFKHLPAERARLLPSHPDNLKLAVHLNPAWWAEIDASGKSNIEKNNALWNAWILQ